MTDNLIDTTFSMSWDDYVNVVRNFGFRQVLTFSFKSEGKDEQYAIFWHDCGILLKCDSCTIGDEVRRNSAVMFFNLGYEKFEDVIEITYSGHVNKTEDVLIASLDAREFLCSNIFRLQRTGKLLNPWIERPFLWLLHHADAEDKYNYGQINEQRIEMLPEDVRMAITPRAQA